MNVTKIIRRNFSIMDLNPAVRPRFQQLIDRAATIETNSKYRLTPLEGYRHPMRQQYLLAVKKTTKAGPWKSAHQYGLAVDFAGHWIDEIGKHHWTWDLPTEVWSSLKRDAAEFDLLIPIKWDLGHVEAPEFGEMKTVIRS